MKRLLQLLGLGRPERIYLDHAASTPISASISRLITEYSTSEFGNPSAIHEEGRRARKAIEDARQRVAEVLKVKAGEIYFVSGGTEANNLALQGFFDALIASGRPLEECEVLSTAIEHPSILGVLEQFKKCGGVVSYIPVSLEGIIDQHAFQSLLTPKTVLVTFAYANSEIGVVQDVKKISRAVRLYKKETKSLLPYIHLDASQAPLYLPCVVDSLGVDMMTLDAAKFGGPKGIGILMKKNSVPMKALLLGGTQEEGLRPGTENTPAIVGCAQAFVDAQARYASRAKRVQEVREYAFSRLLEIPGAVVNGSRTDRIANNVNISIPGIDGEYAVVTLDTHGIAVSTKSACSGRTGSGSHVIYVLGGDDARALSTLRISLGEETTKGDIDRCVHILQKHVAHMRTSLGSNLDLSKKE